MISSNSHNFNKHPTPAVSNDNGNNRSPFDLFPSHDPTLTFRLTGSVSWGASGFWLQTCLVPPPAQNSVQKTPAPVKLREKYLQGRPLHVSLKDSQAKKLRVFARSHLTADQQPLRTDLLPEPGNPAARVLLLLIFLSGYLSLAAAFWSAAQPVVRITRTDLDSRWRFSAHSALLRPPAPAADANEAPGAGAAASSRFPALPGSDAASEDGMQHLPALCTASPCCYLQLPLPPAVTQAVRGRAFSPSSPARRGGGKAGWWKGRGEGGGRCVRGSLAWESG